ncbi:MAG: peptidoglycan editing factor PgeF [Candidatus Parcubacteria bacterium]|jgi:copper oxidase (laccase) domain-containing protein
MSFLKKVEYTAKGVGHMPLLVPHIKHGFSWGMPNMSFAHGEPLEVEQSEAEFLKMAGLKGDQGIVVMAPEHGVRIVEVSQDDEMRRTVDCDCLVTTEKGLTLAAKPGDCIVAIITTKKSIHRQALALVHAGRKGLDHNILEKVISYLTVKHLIKTADLLVGVAPCITLKNYCIKDVAELQYPEIWNGYMHKREDLYYLDLVGLFRHQLLSAGIKEENMVQYDVDTFDAAQTGETFSHRRSQVYPEFKNGRFIVAAQLD